jgi:pimeloyl-ACP methyl ester carboxylesterase
MSILYKINRLFAVFLLSTLAASGYAQTISGSWKGELNAGAMKLGILFHVSKDACTMDVPQQNAKDIPAQVVLISADSLKIAIPKIGARYEGCLQEGEIKGTFTQSGMAFPLNLKPGKIEIKRPQTPQPPFAYNSEEVYFDNKEAGARLCGTLTYPMGYDKMNKKTVPVVLMITGSGLENRDEEIFSHKPFLVIADYLAKNGIASLRYDDRSYGKSTGDVKNATTVDFMKDAEAGIAYLRSTKKFGKIGALGHSEGGTITFMLGSRQKTDFIISLAGTAVRGDSILVSQNRKILLLSGMPTEMCNDYCKLLEAVYQYKINHRSTDNPKAVIDGIMKETSVQMTGKPVENLAQLLTMKNAWIDSFIAFDPAADIAKVGCPVMAVNGSLDTQVISSFNLATLKKLLPANKRNVIKEYNGLNHLFQHCTTGSSMEYNNIEETFSTEVLRDMASWIKAISK